MKDKFIITPQLYWWNRQDLDKNKIRRQRVEDEFEYTSDKNKNWLSIKELKKL